MTTSTEQPSVLQHRFLKAIGIWAVDETTGLASATGFLSADPNEAIATDRVPELIGQVISQRAAIAVGHCGAAELGFCSDQEYCGFAIPFFMDSQMTSVLLLAGGVDGECRGVMESWQPIGDHGELYMANGCYVGLDRFENVSRFVRFEYGRGLPGLVWSGQCPVIHEDLADHPAFLRAAGASAAELEMGIAFPIVDSDFVASILLISSEKSPIARNVEVWVQQDSGFALSCQYGPIGQTRKAMPVDALVQQCADSGCPAICEDLSEPGTGMTQSSTQPEFSAALAIPVIGSESFQVLVIYL